MSKYIHGGFKLNYLQKYLLHLIKQGVRKVVQNTETNDRDCICTKQQKLNNFLNLITFLL